MRNTIRPFVYLTLLVAPATLLGGCSKKSQPAAPTREGGPTAGPGVASELTPFQGTWSVAKLEVLPGGNSPEINAVSDADRQKIVVTITDKLVKIDLPEEGPDPWVKYFVLST